MKWNRTALAVIGLLLLCGVVLLAAMSTPAVQQAVDANLRAATDSGSDSESAPQPDEVDNPQERDAGLVTDSEYWSDPANVGKPYPPGEVAGLLTFRGNPTRTYYGQGPAPRTTPQQVWRYPEEGGLCGVSNDGGGPQTWCGTGWTGQPTTFQRDDRQWLVFGAYDYGVHFVDADTGEQILPPFKTGDIIKGTVTIDPDGYPLVYTGSRDNYLRAIAFDGKRPRELWKLSADAVSPIKWNNDWDGSPLVIDDYLFEGGENSQFHIVKLNRGYDERGRVTVDPELVFNTPGWDEKLLTEFGSDQVSIENSVSIYQDTVYFANSAGLVQGWDISGLTEGRKPKQTFRFWTGDDTDASIVIDEQGFLYVGSEYEKGNARSRKVGQMIKLDPSSPDKPLVWSVNDQDSLPAGIWGTPALHKDTVIFDTNAGEVLALDRETGKQRWSFRLAGPTWQSPVVVDDVLVIGDCSGKVRGYDVADTAAEPVELWQVKVGGCIESTPAVWDGRIYIGTRDGGIHALAASDGSPLPTDGESTATVPDGQSE
ncbi:MAG: PQQ-binding-like beta-propeller repeat protein [Actinomycetia bacterium]|nr:PQQ-binding-like beta-propeller repeat protein [Actinomycetes bacterium]MCH9800741.1 PQQ-binding-like beta-propeller repeat protein [Actinomycetes bacterium]